MHPGADVGVHHPAEAGEHALLLLLDDMQPAQQHPPDNGDRRGCQKSPLVFLIEIEYGVDCARTRR